MSRKTFIHINDHDLISLAFSLPEADAVRQRTGVIIAHGAGNDMDHPLLVAAAHGLARAGHVAARFNFPYREKGLNTPDRREILEQAWIEARECFANESGCDPDGIVAAGKSLGGRIASHLVAAGRLKVRGLVFLGYPLHPPGQPEQLRDDHLYRIGVPMLFFAGTRDPLCDMSKLRTVLKRLTSPCDLSIIEGGDHSLDLPAAARIPPAQIHANVTARIARWLKAC